MSYEGLPLKGVNSWPSINPCLNTFIFVWDFVFVFIPSWGTFAPPRSHTNACVLIEERPLCKYNPVLQTLWLIKTEWTRWGSSQTKELRGGWKDRMKTRGETSVFLVWQHLFEGVLEISSPVFSLRIRLFTESKNNKLLKSCCCFILHFWLCFFRQELVSSYGH